jgi:hypothetical protein
LEGEKEQTKDWKIVAAQKTLRFFYDNRETITFLAGASLIGFCTLIAISETVTVSKMCNQNCAQAYHELGDIMDQMSGKVKCCYCGKKYKKLKALRKHERVHQMNDYLDNLGREILGREIYI